MPESSVELGEKKVSFELLVARAIDKSLPVETMKEILAMVREQKEAWAKEQYFEALAKFQEECPIITNETDVRFKARSGTMVDYSYATIGAIVKQVKKPLKDNGFSYHTTTKQTKELVVATCHLHHREGHSESSDFEVPIDFESHMSPPQRVKSARTYALRVAFLDVTGIMTADPDDDGQAGYTGDGKSKRRHKEYSDEPVDATYEVGSSKKSEKTDPTADAKSLYDSVCAELGKELLPPNQTTNLRDTADRLLDQNNRDALTALLESIKRQTAGKEKSA